MSSLIEAYQAKLHEFELKCEVMGIKPYQLLRVHTDGLYYTKESDKNRSFACIRAEHTSDGNPILVETTPDPPNRSVFSVSKQHLRSSMKRTVYPNSSYNEVERFSLEMLTNGFVEETTKSKVDVRLPTFNISQVTPKSMQAMVNNNAFHFVKLLSSQQVNMHTIEMPAFVMRRSKGVTYLLSQKFSDLNYNAAVEMYYSLMMAYVGLGPSVMCVTLEILKDASGTSYYGLNSILEGGFGGTPERFERSFNQVNPEWPQRTLLADALFQLFEHSAAAGIVHTDIKALNMIIVGSRMLFIDFDPSYFAISGLFAGAPFLRSMQLVGLWVFSFSRVYNNFTRFVMSVLDTSYKQECLDYDLRTVEGRERTRTLNQAQKMSYSVISRATATVQANTHSLRNVVTRVATLRSSILHGNVVNNPISKETFKYDDDHETSAFIVAVLSAQQISMHLHYSHLPLRRTVEELKSTINRPRGHYVFLDDQLIHAGDAKRKYQSYGHDYLNSITWTSLTHQLPYLEMTMLRIWKLQNLPLTHLPEVADISRYLDVFQEDNTGTSRNYQKLQHAILKMVIDKNQLPELGVYSAANYSPASFGRFMLAASCTIATFDLAFRVDDRMHDTSSAPIMTKLISIQFLRCWSYLIANIDVDTLNGSLPIKPNEMVDEISFAEVVNPLSVARDMYLLDRLLWLHASSASQEPLTNELRTKMAEYLFDSEDWFGIGRLLMKQQRTTYKEQVDDKLMFKSVQSKIRRSMRAMCELFGSRVHMSSSQGTDLKIVSMQLNVEDPNVSQDKIRTTFDYFVVPFQADPQVNRSTQQDDLRLMFSQDEPQALVSTQNMFTFELSGCLVDTWLPSAVRNLYAKGAKFRAYVNMFTSYMQPIAAPLADDSLQDMTSHFEVRANESKSRLDGWSGNALMSSDAWRNSLMIETRLGEL